MRLSERHGAFSDLAAECDHQGRRYLGEFRVAHQGRHLLLDPDAELVGEARRVGCGVLLQIVDWTGAYADQCAGLRHSSCLPIRSDYASLYIGSKGKQFRCSVNRDSKRVDGG